MSQLDIKTRGNRVGYLPGEEIRGQFSWKLSEAPEKMELRLCYYTDRSRRREVDLTEVQVFRDFPAEGNQDFLFILPEGPYSFVGKLLSLRWALELVVLPEKKMQRLELVVSPTKERIVLHR
jgi:hypothetical protein